MRSCDPRVPRLTLIQHTNDSSDLDTILTLVKQSFSFMEGRIDPPSSVNRLDIEGISDHCNSGEVWTFGVPIVACLFLKPKDDALYLGRLAVTENERGKGIGRKLIEHAEIRAGVHDKHFLELFTRIELTENHRLFAQYGFEKTDEVAHAGFARPTYIIMRKALTR